MKKEEETEVLSLERRFFKGLVSEPEVVDQILANDFRMIDVLSGSEVTRSEVMTALRSGDLKFENINPLTSQVRFYDATALVTGSTEMSGRFGSDSFSVLSRYTHVYVKVQESWRLVSAQGTQIKPR
jgi:hypothetical protein